MSEDTESTSQDAQMVAELKDGQLEIVEIQYDKSDQETEELVYEGGSADYKYMQVIDASGKSGVLDLLNMTLIKCYSDGDTYRLVAGDGAEGAGAETVACILSNEEDEQEEQFMVVDDSDKPLVYLQADCEDTFPEEDTDAGKVEAANQQPSPQWIIEKAKALQKSKSLLASLQRRERKGRRRKGELPPPHELLSSPTFKLYLYSCKLCTFKCNAIKELQAHKAAEHGGAGGAGGQRGGRAGSIALQCPRCPFRGHTHAQLSKHVQEAHAQGTRRQGTVARGQGTVARGQGTTEVTYSEAINLDSAEVDAADVLVCGACGFESPSKDVFRKHIEEEHGATAC